MLQQKANLLFATQNWDRARKLGPSDALAQSAYDQYKANFEVAKANLAAAEAAVAVAKAAVEQAEANLRTARINLDYCTIKSPVKGVVIDRRVNIGQTVVSSTARPEPVPHRQRPEEADPGLGLGERGGRGQHRRGPARGLHRGRLPRPGVPRAGGPGAAQRHHDPERGHLHHRGGHGQFRRQAAALPHRQRPVRDRPAQGRAPGAQRGPALAAQARPDRPGVGRRARRPPPGRPGRRRARGALGGRRAGTCAPSRWRPGSPTGPSPKCRAATWPKGSGSSPARRSRPDAGQADEKNPFGPRGARGQHGQSQRPAGSERPGQPGR